MRACALCFYQFGLINGKIQGGQGRLGEENWCRISSINRMDASAIISQGVYLKSCQDSLSVLHYIP